MITIYGFNNLVPYIGIWGTIFLSSCFIYVIIRIGFSFVFGWFRKYKALTKHH